MTRVINEPVPVGQKVHRELVRIARETLTNAVKHADATEIVVELRFPQRPDGMIELQVWDDGRSGRPIVARPWHLGLYYMEESAQAIGGVIHWGPGPAGGTVVAVSAPAIGAGSLGQAQGGRRGVRSLPTEGRRSTDTGRLDDVAGG